MINRLPNDQTFGAAEIVPLRDKILNKETKARIPAAAKIVTRALETCRENLRIETSPHLRSCIAEQHDMLSTNSTQEIWRALQPGG